MPKGLRGCYQVIADPRDAEKVTIVIKATWDRGELTGAMKELIKATLIKVANPVAPNMLISSSDKKTNGGTLSYEFQVPKSLAAVRELAKWNAEPWSAAKSVPTIGDMRTFDQELPNLGRVRTVEKCLKFESTDLFHICETCVSE